MLDFSQPDQPLTPEQKKRKDRNQGYSVLAFLFFLLLGFKAADWAKHVQAKAHLLGFHWVVFVVGWLVGISVLNLLMVFVHESGHVIGALLSRFRVFTFVVSWLRITRQATGWKVCFVKPQAKVGGMINAFPTHSRSLRRRYSLLIAGGPAANITTGALALYGRHLLEAHHTLPFTPLLAEYLLTNALFAFGWISLVRGGLNLLPFKLTSGHIIDGRQLLNLFQGGPAMHQHLGMLQLQGLIHAGVRPRDWDFTLVEQLLAHRSNGVLDCYAHIYAYNYFHDRNELEPLRFHINEALDRRRTAPVALQQYLLNQAVSIAALYTRDAEQARYWLESAQQVKPFTKEEGLFAQAAVAYVEGRLSEAVVWLQAARKQMNEAFASGSSKYVAEQIDDLQTRIQQAQLRLQTA